MTEEENNPEVVAQYLPYNLRSKNLLTYNQTNNETMEIEEITEGKELEEMYFFTKTKDKGLRNLKNEAVDFTER